MKIEKGNIVYHNKFGFGVVKKNDNSIIDVLFSNDTLHKLMAYNAIIEVVDPKLIDIIIQVDSKSYFDSWTLSKAKSYKSSIADIKYSNNEISASVHGTYLYNTSIKYEKDHLRFNCDCPVSGKCKHEAALYLKMKDIFAKLKENNVSSSIDINIMKKIKEMEYLYYQHPNFIDEIFYIHDYVINNLNNDIIYSTLKCIYNYKKHTYRNQSYDYLTDVLIFDDRIRKIIYDNYLKYNDIYSMISEKMSFADNIDSVSDYDKVILYHYVNGNSRKIVDTYLNNYVTNRSLNFVYEACRNIEIDEEVFNELYRYLLKDRDPRNVDILINKLSFDQLKKIVEDKLYIIDYEDIKNYSLQERKQILKYVSFGEGDIDELINNNFDGIDNLGIAKIIFGLFNKYLSKKNANKLLGVVKKLPNNKYMYEHLSYIRDRNEYIYDEDDYYYRRNNRRTYGKRILHKNEKYTYNDVEFFTYFYSKYDIRRYEDEIITYVYLYDLDGNEIIDASIYIDHYSVNNNEYDGNDDSDVVRYVIDYTIQNNLEEYERQYHEIENAIKQEKDIKKSEEARLDLDILSKVDNPIVLKDNHKARLEYYFDTIDGNKTLSFKIGIDKMYVVKNACQFIENIKDETSEEYGKNFVFSHLLNNFELRDKQILEELIKSNQNMIYKKELIIQNKMLEYIFDTLKDNTIYFKRKSYTLTLNKKDINFRIDENYRLKINDEYDKYSYLFTNNKIYIIDDDNKTIDYLEGTYKQIVTYNYLIRNDNTKIDSFVNEFKENIYYDYQNIITIDDKLKNDFKIDEILIKAYFDYDDKTIKVNSEYYIDDAKIDDSKIVENHNLIKKNRYLEYLNNLGFIDNVMENDGDILNFFSMDFSELKKYCEVYLSESITNKKLYQFAPGTIKINYENNMMEAFLQDSKYSDDELYEILKAIKKKKKFVIMSDDRIVNIDSNEANEFLDAVSDLGLKKEHLSQSVALPISKALKAFSYEQECEIDEYLLNMVNDISNFKDYKLKIPKLNGELRTYQKEGYKWLSILNKYHVGGILADDMGLGKTIEIISLIASNNNKKPNLVVCPKSVVFNWVNEFKKFAPEEEIEEIYGLKNDRDNIVKNIKQNKKVTYVVSYDSLRNDIESYKMNFNYVILDEAQYIKNVNAQKTSSVKKLKAEHHLALTGTPIENNIIDLWSIFDFVMPGYFEDLETFKHKYESDEKFVERVAKRIAPFVLRRNKQNVLKDLPDKYEHIITAQMTTKQQKIYDAHVKQARDMLESGSKAFDVLPYLMRLRQICIDPRLFVENYIGDSGKLNMLKEIVEDYTNNDHRILIFSQFVKALDEVKKILDDLKLSYFVITGDTDAKKRIEICNSFNNNSEQKVVLVSLKAGGTGLNLTGADTVIHLDPWWNVAATDQATDRTYRIGQTRNVEVIKLICENSIEQRVIELQNIKKDLIDKLISNDESSVVNATLEDIRFIIS